MKKLFSNQAASIAPYSEAIQSNNYVFLSGQIALSPDTGEVIIGDIKTQTKRILDGIKDFLEEKDLTMDNIVKCNIYMTDYDNDFADMNAVYLSYFTQPYPARLTIGVKSLYPDCRIEIDAIIEIS